MSCYRNILVAIDGSADADAAVLHASRLAEDQRARLTLLTLAPYPYQLSAMGVPSPPDQTDCYVETLRRAVQAVSPDVGLTSRLLHGSAAETILRTIGEGEHDLVVMGSHGHSRLHRALLGSVSHRVLHDSPVPVLLIRHQAQQPADAALLGGARAVSPDPGRGPRDDVATSGLLTIGRSVQRTR
jgi:nucleotide-binding universal stress UspA family protein